LIDHSDAVIRGEYEFITLDGNHKWLDVCIQNQLNNAWVKAVILNFYDITTLKENLENLKGEKERYDILAKATSDTIWDWDIQNDKMQYNSGITEMFGYNQSEIENTENWWQNKIHPDDLEKVINKVNKVLTKKDNQMQFKYRFLCQDGSYKYIYDRAFLIFDANHKPTRMIGAMQDVTEFRNYLLAIRRQNLKLKKIAWTQSHFVRAPLARIMGLINLLKSNPSEEILDHLSTASKELDDVLRDIVKGTE
jgi:PAS domain S-box-containing protein